MKDECNWKFQTLFNPHVLQELSDNFDIHVIKEGPCNA